MIPRPLALPGPYLVGGRAFGVMATTRVRKHKSSGTQWTAAQHREAGRVQMHAWIPAELRARIDTQRARLGLTVPEVLEAAIALLEQT